MDESIEEKGSDAKSEVAKQKPRDEHGHFVHTGPVHQDPQEPSPAQPSIVSHFIPTETHIAQTKDDATLLDVHVGNPLRKMTLLLEEIKRQKAFTFDIKGSLGVAGILLVFTTFGIFGGTHAFCSRGVQSHAGMIHVLAYPEPQPKKTILDRILSLWKTDTVDAEIYRVTLIKTDGNILHLSGMTHTLTNHFNDSHVIVTGDYDVCSQTVTISDLTAIENPPQQ